MDRIREELCEDSVATADDSSIGRSEHFLSFDAISGTSGLVAHAGE